MTRAERKTPTTTRAFLDQMRRFSLHAEADRIIHLGVTFSRSRNQHMRALLFFQMRKHTLQMRRRQGMPAH